MIALRMIREISGKEKINELEKTYGSIKNLKRLFENDNENMLLYSDLEDWEYFLKHPDETIEEGKTIFPENISLNTIELELLSFIKNKNPSSISELARLVNKEVSSVQKKVNSLEEEGLLSFETGTKNRKIPRLNYDKIEIAI